MNENVHDFSYIADRLRTPIELFKKGGHVTMVYRDQKFRMAFDNKRKMITKNLMDLNSYNPTMSLLDSAP